jgi:prepilin-type processing-associated H-X9-DG protein
VVIAITAVLGGLSMVGIRSFRQKAMAATASSSLRQNAIAIQGYLGDKGRYPEAWDFRGGSGGGSWAWQIRDYLGFDGESSWPAGSLLHPRHGSKGIDGVRGWDRENLHHFAASAVLFQDVNDTKTYVRAVKVNNPTTVVMLGDAPLKREGTPSSGCHAAWWSLRDGTVNGTPNTPVGQSTLIDSVDFWMSGKAHFLFADGHVEALAPTQVLRKHFQL